MATTSGIMAGIQWEDVTNLPPPARKWEPHLTEHSLSDDARAVMLKMGRVPFKVNFVVTKEEDAKYDTREAELDDDARFVPANPIDKYRTRVKNLADGNVWSSIAFIKEDWHLPVLDVDTASDPIKAKIVGAFTSIFGYEPAHEWVPSTHEGHYHLYVNDLMHWDDFQQLLWWLSAEGLIEHGYAAASVDRKATFVRFPWVKKEVVNDDGKPFDGSLVPAQDV